MQCMICRSAIVIDLYVKQGLTLQSLRLHCNIIFKYGKLQQEIESVHKNESWNNYERRRKNSCRYTVLPG